MSKEIIFTAVLASLLTVAAIAGAQKVGFLK